MEKNEKYFAPECESIEMGITSDVLVDSNPDGGMEEGGEV